jgi:hypothetical protein
MSDGQGTVRLVGVAFGRTRTGEIPESGKALRAWYFPSGTPCEHPVELSGIRVVQGFSGERYFIARRSRSDAPCG